MTAATYRSMSTATAADVYADQLGQDEAREDHIQSASRSLALRWRSDWKRIMDIVAESTGDDAKQIGMSICALLDDKSLGNRPISVAMLNNTISNMLHQEAENEIRKEIRNERHCNDI